MNQGVLSLIEDTWRKSPHNAPLIRLLLSARVVDKLRQDRLFIPSSFWGADKCMSFRVLMMGYINRGLLLGGVSLHLALESIARWHVP